MTWQKGRLADFMGDRVIYRNLEPVDAAIPGLRASWREIGLPRYAIPRKTLPEYARALCYFVERAQAARGVAQPISRALFIGDTLMNDGTAARNVAASLPLMGFIGADRLKDDPKREIDGELMVANRWAALSDFADWVRDAAFVCDETTALLIDLDKTSLGARGRNDKVIDGARVQAVERTMRSALGDDYDQDAFRALYDRLNQVDYHYFTADNQDYLAYICLMVTGGAFAPDELWDDLAARRLLDITGFVRACDERVGSMSDGLRQAHAEVLHGIEVDDPTPFKGFRRGEYFQTVACMDSGPDDASVETVLSSEIVITAEVASFAAHMAEQGVLVFGISDKPDEASVPTDDAAAKGYRAIHQTTMKVYGQSIF